MLKVALQSTASAFSRQKEISTTDKSEYAVLLETDVMEPVELVDDVVQLSSDTVTADADVASEMMEEDDEDMDDGRWETEDDEDDVENDSDYVEEEIESTEDDEDDDEDEYLKSLEMELDENVDEVSDFYLKRMLEERDRIEGEDAEWVEKYIEAQRVWKETHGTSIDEIDLDLRLAGKMRKTASNEDEQQLDELRNAWHGRVSPLLPASLRQKPAEYVVSMVAVGFFVALALGIQFYVAFQAPRYT